MIGKEVIANLLSIISEADLEQEVYFKDGSNYIPVDSIKLDRDNGILFSSGLDFYCDCCAFILKDGKCSACNF